MGKRKQINIGDKFGKLTIVKEVAPNVTPCGTIQRKFLCKCECGNEVLRSLQTLTKGAKSSCGCTSYQIGELNKKYEKGTTKSFLYSTWSGMKQRCYDPKSDSYKNYGGRGIKICDEWRLNFLAFKEWSLANGARKGLTIDRIDNNGIYCPNNCRWVDLTTQANNTRQNRIIEYNGKVHTLSEWSRKVGIGADIIRGRIDRYGYSIGEALGYVNHEKINHKTRKYNWKKILQYTLDGIFVKEWDGVTDIAKAYGCSKHCIQVCCYGKSNSSQGFIWKYKE